MNAPALQSLLRERIERMLAPGPPARVLYRYALSRVVVLALFVLFVIRSFFLGNS